jgi:hypothetical protein
MGAARRNNLLFPDNDRLAIDSAYRRPAQQLIIEGLKERLQLHPQKSLTKLHHSGAGAIDGTVSMSALRRDESPQNGAAL